MSDKMTFSLPYLARNIEARPVPSWPKPPETDRNNGIELTDCSHRFLRFLFAILRGFFWEGGGRGEGGGSSGILKHSCGFYGFPQIPIDKFLRVSKNWIFFRLLRCFMNEFLFVLFGSINLVGGFLEVLHVLLL